MGSLVTLYITISINHILFWFLKGGTGQSSDGKKINPKPKEKKAIQFTDAGDSLFISISKVIVLSLIFTFKYIKHQILVIKLKTTKPTILIVL